MLGFQTSLVDFTPVCFICRCACNTGGAGGKLLSKGIDQVGRRFRDDLVTARSDVKAEETLYRYQIGNIHPSWR